MLVADFKSVGGVTRSGSIPPSRCFSFDSKVVRFCAKTQHLCTLLGVICQKKAEKRCFEQFEALSCFSCLNALFAFATFARGECTLLPDQLFCHLLSLASSRGESQSSDLVKVAHPCMGPEYPIAVMISTGVGCRLQICRRGDPQRFDSAFAVFFV